MKNGGFYNQAKTFAVKNKNLVFIATLILVVIIISLASYYSVQGFDIRPVIVIPGFLALMYFNVTSAPWNYKKSILLLFIISGLFQSYLGVEFYGTKHDIEVIKNWAIIFDAGLNPFIYGQDTTELDSLDLYRPKGRYDPPSHFPPVALLSFGILKLSQLTNIPYETLTHLPSIFSVMVIGLLLLRFMRHKNRKDKEIFKILVLYLYNPVTLMISGYHGQWDSLAIVFLLAYYTYLERSRIINPLSHLIYGISIVMKQVTVFPFMFFLNKRKGIRNKIIFVLLSGLPLVLLSIFFLDLSFTSLTKDLITQSGRTVFGHSGTKGLWGYSRIEAHLTTSMFNLPQIHDIFLKIYPIVVLGMFFLMFIYFYKNRNINYLDGIMLSFLFFFAVTPGFGVQYLIWILPFAVLNPNRFYYFYSLFGGLLLLVFYYALANENFFIMHVLGFSLFGLPLWVVIITWFVWYLRKIKKYGKVAC